MSETHALRLVGITRRNPNQHLYHILYIYINMNKQLHISVLMYSYCLNHKLTGFLCVDRCWGYAYIHAQHVQPHLCLKPCCAHLGICFFWEVMDVGAENICPVDTAIWLSVPCQSARAIQIYVRACHQMVGNICK